jgi:hypothetical protein
MLQAGNAEDNQRNEEADQRNKAVQFTSEIPEAGKYEIFSYFAIVNNGSARTYVQFLMEKEERSCDQ